MIQFQTLLNWHQNIRVDDAAIDKTICIATKDTGLIVFMNYLKNGLTNLGRKEARNMKK